MTTPEGPEARYIEDIATIRRIVAEHEEQPLLEHWAFWIWGALITAGTLVHYALAPGYAGSPTRLALLVWAPTVILGATQETAAFARRLNADEVPLSTRKIRRLLMQAGGVFTVVFAVLLHELPGGIHPGVIMLLGALAMLPYGHATYGALFAEAFVLIAAGLVVLVLAPASPGFFVVAGLAVGGTYAACGVHSLFLERRPVG
jgi:hypothetical protein